MFADIVIVLATFCGLAAVDKLSFPLAIALLIVLTYLCTAKCIQEDSDSVEDYDIDRQLTFRGIGLSWYRCIFSPRWYYFVRGVNDVIFLMKILRQVGRDRREEGSGQHPACEWYIKDSQHCGADCCVNREIRTVVDCIMRDYIQTWYSSKISSNKDFIQDVDYIIYDTLVAFFGRFASVDKATFGRHVLQVYIHYFTHFKDAFGKSENSGGILHTCLTKKKNIVNNFEVHHWAMKDKVTEWTYLQSLTGTLIESFGPVELLSCPLLHTIVVEILTQNVMFHLVKVLTDPERINVWIAKLIQNILKLENAAALLPQINSDHNGTSVPIIHIDSDSNPMTGDDVEPTSSTIPQVNTIEAVDGNICSNSSISDLDNISNTSCQTCDISLDKISNISNESDRLLTSNGSPDVFFHKERDETKSQFFLGSPSLLRTYSNTNIAKTRADFCSDSKMSLLPNVLQMKRSKSADHIDDMNIPHDSKNLLPLKLLNRSFRYSKMQANAENPVMSDIEVAEEATEKELPPLFSNVKITDTLQQEDAGHNPYILYCIQYRGVYQNISPYPSEPELVEQEMNIKRRFREFLVLQSRLEDNPSIKIHLKGIKGPSKWLATPFANLDKKNIAERKIFLQSYLQALCKKDVIVRSIELQEFLAYGGDASIAYVKKSSDINVPRIDKFIVRGVKGAIDLFRTALPTSAPDTVSVKEPSPSIEETAADESNNKFQEHLIDYAKRCPEIVKHSDDFIRRFDVSSSTESLYDESVPITAHRESSKRNTFLQHNHNINSGEGCSCHNTVSVTDLSYQERLLADAVADLIYESLPHTSLFSRLMKFLPMSFLQSYLEDKLEDIDEQKCSIWLHTFHKSVWPDVKVQQSQQHPNLVNNICEVLNKQFEGTRCYSRLLCGVFGSDDISESIELLIGSLQNDKLNRCLLFYIFDVIIQAVCSR